MSGTTIIYALWSALAGALIPVMATLNGTLGRTLQAPFHAAAISVSVAFATVLTTLLVARPAMPTLEAAASVPKLAWVGGFAMAFYALTVTFVTPKFGVGNVVIAVVVAQLVVAALIDQFGLFGAPVMPLDMRRVVGLVVLGAGAALVAWK